jgi:hypothetical protein
MAKPWLDDVSDAGPVPIARAPNTTAILWRRQHASVRMRLIADNNAMLIEALHLRAHRGTVERGRWGSLVFRRLSSTSHATLAGLRRVPFIC